MHVKFDDIFRFERTNKYIGNVYKYIKRTCIDIFNVFLQNYYYKNSQNAGMLFSIIRGKSTDVVFCLQVISTYYHYCSGSINTCATQFSEYILIPPLSHKTNILNIPVELNAWYRGIEGGRHQAKSPTVMRNNIFLCF